MPNHVTALVVRARPISDNLRKAMDEFVKSPSNSPHWTSPFDKLRDAKKAAEEYVVEVQAELSRVKRVKRRQHLKASLEKVNAVLALVTLRGL